jgi:hypothetical protein
MRCAGSKAATSWAFADYGFDIYGAAVIANTNWLQSTPDDVVTRMMVGIIQSSTAMKRDPEHAFTVLKEGNPSAVLDRTQQLASMANPGGYTRWSWDAPSKPFETNGFGWIDVDEMAQSESRLVDAGLLPQTLPAERYYTAKYLNDPAVRQAALDFQKAPWGDIPNDVKQQCGVG